MRRLAFPVLLAALVWIGCPETDDDDTSGGGDDDVSGDDDDGAATDLLITVTESRYPSTGDVYAYASAGSPIPWDVYWIPTLFDGPCIFYDAYLPLCDPPCVPPEICVADGVCEELPRSPYVGTIEVDGLSVGASLIAEAPYYYYVQQFDDDPPDGNLFDEGDPIEASAPGEGDVPAFAVATVGVADLIPELACPPPIVAGQPLTVQWTSGTQGDPVRFTLRSGNHGNQFSSVVCETGDSGELVVGAELIDAYLEAFHPVDVWTLERIHSGQTQAGDTRVELQAVSSASCTY